MGGRLWTTEEDTVLKSLFSEGADDPEIAASLGRTERSVFHRRRNLRLLRCPYTHWTMAGLAQLKEMFDDGASDKEMAAALNRTPEAVEAKRGILGLKRWFPKPVSPEKQAKLEAAERHREALARWGKL